MSLGENDPFRDLEPTPEEHPLTNIGTPRWVAVALALLAVLGTSALWVSVKSLRNSQDRFSLLNRETQRVEADNVRLSRLLGDRLAQMEKKNADLRGEVAVLNDKFETVQEDAQAAQKQAQRVREQDREQIKQLAVVNTLVREQLATKVSTDDLRTVSSDVATVRASIKATRNDLELGRSEMGTLIARNHDEIEILRQMGDRNYFEFTLTGKNASEKMGDVTITLRSTDPKKNEFNLELLMDDKTTVKRNRAINEPIFFYRDRERVPGEIVINQVTKNRVIGYLSFPKEKQLTIAGAN